MISYGVKESWVTTHFVSFYAFVLEICFTYIVSILKISMKWDNIILHKM